MINSGLKGTLPSEQAPLPSCCMWRHSWRTKRCLGDVDVWRFSVPVPHLGRRKFKDRNTIGKVELLECRWRSDRRLECLLSLLWLFPRLLLHLSIIFSEVWLQNLLRLSSIIITSHPDVGRKQGKCCSYKWSDEHAAHYAFQAVRTSQMLHTHLPSNVPKLVSHLMSTSNMAPWLEMPWICLGFSILLDTHVMSRPPCQVINHARRGCMCPSNTTSMVFTTVAAYQRPVVNRQWPLANCKWVRVNIGGDDLTTKHQRHINDTYSHHMPELKETSMCPRVLWELAPIGLSVDLSLVESSTFSNVTQHVAGEGIEFISGTGLRTYREIATRHCEEFWALDVSIKVPHFSVTPLSLNWAHSLVVL